MRKNVLVVVAHADDEVLGCGGAMARHSASSDTVDVVIMADGVTSRKGVGRKGQLVAERRRAARKAGDILGVHSMRFHDFPDNRMDSMALLDVVRTIEAEMRKSRPSLVYTHHSGDLNVDHAVVHDAVVVACRPQPGSVVTELLFAEVQSSTEWRPALSRSPFQPNWFVDISSTLELKLKALAAYRQELRDYPHPRSLEAVEHLSRWRGASIGVKAAEAFELGRKIT